MTRLLTLVVAACVLQVPLAAQSPRFYPDDPLAAEPTPLPVEGVDARLLSAVLETVSNSFKMTGQRHPAGGVVPAGGVNTLGEVMDGDWYVNRHAAGRLSIADLRRGPGSDRPPSSNGPLQVLVVKRFGLNPGLLVADERGELYILRLDQRGRIGLTTGAQMVTSRFMHALGYHVPENYLLHFERSRLVAYPTGEAVSSAGRRRPLVTADIDGVLETASREPAGTYRAVAVRVPERRETLLGPYQVWGTRSDDPNDTTLHEHRRDLRGLFVFAAWLDFSDAGAVGTQDMLSTVDGVPRIRHYLVDFTISLGAGVRGPKQAWEGHENRVPSGGTIARNIASLGLVTPAWMREKHPGLAEVGAFGSSAFDPESWTTNHPLPPFANRLPDDTYWAARQVMAFTDEEIRAIVQAGEYSKPAEDWITATLIERRNRLGRAYLTRVLSLDRFRIAGGALAFDDLGVQYGFATARSYTIEWAGFDNEAGTLGTALGTGPALPAAAQNLASGSYVAARIHAGDLAMTVTVFLRRRADGFDLVGIDRAWPGKVVAAPIQQTRANRRLYADLEPRQKALYETYAAGYNAARGSTYSPEESFERLTISEQTTFYGVTHALMQSSLTEQNGAPLGTALDRIASVDRIAGQYAGRGGDQQFRLYVTLKPDTQATLERSREFFKDHENTVYHVGFPHSFRQVGKEPNLQFSLSDDGLRADIDVDYRSSRSPQALFNGHLTSANSDVRAGDNSAGHNSRWQGLVAWWQQTFGRLVEALPHDTDLLGAARPSAPSAPLPPDRPAGAAPDRIEDAAQEFLTDWLVRRQYDQALQFLSSQAYACVNLTDDARPEAIDADGARRELRRLMQYAGERLGVRPDLSGVIESIAPRDPRRTVMDHRFKNEFLLGPVPPAEARQYLCSQAAAAQQGTEYYGVVFQFRPEGGGVLGLLWTREGGRWTIVSYQPLRP